MSKSNRDISVNIEYKDSPDKMTSVLSTELNPRIQDKLKKVSKDLSDLNKLSSLLNDIEANKHLFGQFEHKISVTFRGQKVI